MKIMFTGGGTLGPVTPLLAVAEAWKTIDPSVQFVWVGTRHGPERAMIDAAGIRFLHLPVARLTRYPSLEWLALPFTAAAAFLMAWLFIGREEPDLVASAGGYTAVPLAYAARLHGVPVWIHQQDVRPLLANRLCAPVACAITVAWKVTAHAFAKRKTTWIGNPVRPSVREGKRDLAHWRFGLDLRKPTVLVMGGGTGAVWLNHMVGEIGPWLAERANIIHVTGPRKLSPHLLRIGKHYTAVELLTDGFADALAAATLVVSRAGMGTITELSACKKPTILIPIPHSLQEENAKMLADMDAAVVLNQSTTTIGDLKKAVERLLDDPKRQAELSARIGALLPTDIAGPLVHHIIAHCLK